ncbi:MAG: polysaccharide deacetylase family protein [Beijerinckiaceae bacterium]
MFRFALFFSAVIFFTQPLTSAAGQDCARPGALGVSRTIAVGAKGGLHIGLKSYPRTLFLKDKEVVLTFDDGPLPATTGKVLDALRAECVKATFFLIGRNAQANPSIVRREIAEGHTVGHHSWSHPPVTLRGLPENGGIEEIRRGIAAVEMAAYGTVYAGGAARVPFFRFPGFADTPATKAWLDKRGIGVFGADLWASDWQRMSPEAELRLVMGRLAKSRGGIVLFHDTHPSTAAMMPAFLRALKAGGYRIVHLVPAADARPLITQARPGWRSETEAFLSRKWPRPAAKSHRVRISDPAR